MRFSPLDSAEDFMGDVVSVFLYLLEFLSYDVINDVDCTPGREPRSVAASFPSYPPNNHHSSDDVYWQGRSGSCVTLSSICMPFGVRRGGSLSCSQV